MMKVQEER
jgi:hypothetical protein